MKKILLIVLGVLVLAAGGWYWYAKTHQTAPGVPAVTDFGAFFPIGANTAPSIEGQLQSPDSVATTDIQQKNSPFTQLSPDAVAGFTAYTYIEKVKVLSDPSNPKSKVIEQSVPHHVVRYVSRANGYVYEIVDGSIPLQITNVYIPNIYEASFADNNQTAVLRFLRDDQQTIATYSVPIPLPNPDGTRTQKEGTYFPDNILQLAPSPSGGTSIARLTSDPTSALLSITNSINAKKVDLLRTPFREWILSWVSPKTLYVQTKASAQVAGFLYSIDTTERKLRRVLGNINGLTTSVSPSGTYILYSQNSGQGFVTKLFNTKTSATQSLTLSILPEKCAWSSLEDVFCAGTTTLTPAVYPDAWYQGTVSFSDQLYHIYTKSVIYDTLYDNSGQSFDMTNLQVNEDQRILYFMDKTSGVLWQYQY